MARKRPNPGTVVDDKTATLIREAAAALQEFDNVSGLDDTPGGVNDMTTVSDSVDGTKIAFDQSMLEAWSANVKAMFEQHLRDAEREREQVNRLNAFNERVSEQQNTLALANAQNASVITHLANMAGLAQLSEYRGIGAQVAEQASEAATAAVNSALAQGAQSNPVAQGTTGLSQGAIQAGVAGVNVATLTGLAEFMASTGAVNTALLTQLTRINDALGVILVRVTGDAVIDPVPPVA